MEAIGGYFGLELGKREHYHPKALRLNSGRNCLEYLLRVRKYRKVFIPYYTCEVVLEPLIKLKVSYEFYHINEYLEPIYTIQLKQDEAFLYTNYFGLKQSCVEWLSEIYGKQLIVDNAQAFYAEPIDGIDTFYSPRKFFGVPDGGYLYIDKFLEEELPQDVSYGRTSHLLKRLDLSAEEGYQDFCMNDESLNFQPMKRMSQLTEKILKSINYDLVKHIRTINFQFLSTYLDVTNKLNIELNDCCIPMVYPYYSGRSNDKHLLLKNRIYVATYWTNVLKWTNTDMIEYKLANNLLPIPCDQRYEEKDINCIIRLLINS